MKITTAKKRITPESKYLPCYMVGHAMRQELCKGVADELYTEAMVLEIEDQKLVFISYDLIGGDRDATEKIRDAISAKYNVPSANINIAYVHTHSAPAFSKENIFSDKYGAVPGYWEYVESQILAAVEDCFSQEPMEVEAYYKVTRVDGFYSNRNGLEKVSDQDITTVTFEKEDGTVVGGWLNFTCHSTVLGPQNLYVSSDLAGYLNRGLQARWGVSPITMIGAAGDMSNRHCRKGNDYAELRRVGDGILSVLDANPMHEKLDLSGLKVGKVYYHGDWKLDPEKKKKQVEIIRERVANAKTFDEKKVYTSALSHAEKSVNNLESHMDYEGCIYRFKDVCICVIPAELFSCLGLKIKAAMDVKCPIIWGYSYYTVGYLADREEYGNSFETAASEIPEGVPEELVALNITKIEEMKG